MLGVELADALTRCACFIARVYNYDNKEGGRVYPTPLYIVLCVTAVEAKVMMTLLIIKIFHVICVWKSQLSIIKVQGEPMGMSMACKLATLQISGHFFVIS